jgi:hypothetical protein
MQSIAILLIILSSFTLGVLTLLGYMIFRMMRNDGWDDSNITNALRLLSHVTMYPHDFGKMYYLTNTQLAFLVLHPVLDQPTPKRPFWYVSKDELSVVVDSRP